MARLRSWTILFCSHVSVGSPDQVTTIAAFPRFDNRREAGIFPPPSQSRGGPVLALDLLIRNGRVVDGSGGESTIADVGIKDGRIVEIGRVQESAGRTIDA